MAEGLQVDANNSSINKKEATEFVWDIKYFQNLGYASNLACTMCGHPPKKSYMDEQHEAFCSKCSESFIQKGVKILENPFADSMVAKAEIACSNILYDPNKNNEEEKGGEEQKQCEWKGLVKDWQSHNDTDCPYTKINCNDCCEYESSRSLQPAHHEVCGFAVIKCPLSCPADILRKDTKDHTENKCPKTVMNCTNDECKEEIIRELLMQHVTELCPKRIVECEYSQYGCNQSRLKYESMENHMADFEIKHIQFQLNRLYQMMAHQNHPQNNQQDKPSAVRVIDDGSNYEPGMIRKFGCVQSKFVPNGWLLCDGQNGTPDLREKFIKYKNGYGHNGFIKATETTKGNDDDFEISEIDDDEEEVEDESYMEDVNARNHIPSMYSMVYIMKA